MKVLLVHSSAELYGSDRCLLWIASALRENGDEVEVVLPFSGPLEDDLAKIMVPVHILDPVVFRRSVMRPASLAVMVAMAGPNIVKLSRLIKKNKFDLVHTNTGVIVGGPAAAKLCGVPHVWHFRELLVEFSALWRLYQPFVIATSNRIVCISRAVAKQFNAPRAEEKVKIIHDGIPLPDRLRDFNDKIPSGPLKLLSIGRIAPYKSQDDLLTAVGYLISRGLDIQLTLVGDVFGGQTEYMHILEKQVKDLKLNDRVTFAGFCKDVNSFLDDADIFVMPSRRPEGLGLVILEAMAHGKPVVTTNGGGITEIIEDGSNGLLVEPGNPVAMARAIEELASNPARSRAMGQKGFATVSERFSVKEMTENILKEYSQVLAQA